MTYRQIGIALISTFDRCYINRLVFIILYESDTMNQKEIGRFIAENREAKKLTQEGLAEKLGRRMFQSL